MVIESQHKIYIYTLKSDIIFTLNFSWVNIKWSNIIMGPFPNTNCLKFCGICFYEISKKSMSQVTTFLF